MPARCSPAGTGWPRRPTCPRRTRRALDHTPALPFSVLAPPTCPFPLLLRLFSPLACLLLLLIGGGSVLVSSSRAQPLPPDTLRLDAAVQQALDDNFQAEIARREAAIAENNATVGNAGFLPTLSLDGGYNT